MLRVRNTGQLLVKGLALLLFIPVSGVKLGADHNDPKSENALHHSIRKSVRKVGANQSQRNRNDQQVQPNLVIDQLATDVGIKP